MAQQVRVLTTVLESDLDLLLSSLQLTCNSNSGAFSVLFWSLKAPAHMWYTYAHMWYTYILTHKGSHTYT